MKKLITVCIPFLLLVNATAFAANADALGVQAQLLGVKAESSKVTADLTIAISIPAFDSIEPIIFEGSINASMTKGEGYALLIANDIPAFVTELKDIPESFRPVSVELKPVGTTIKVYKDESGEVAISNIGFEIKIFKSGNEAMAFTLKDLPLIVDDLGDDYAKLSFSATLPRSDNELFNQVLAGKDVNGTIEVNYQIQ